MRKSDTISRREWNEHLLAADGGFDRLNKVGEALFPTEGRPLRDMVEEIAVNMDFMVNKMSVNGSLGISNILSDHHDTIQSLKDGVGQMNRDVVVLMEVTEKDRLRFDLKKKFKEYRTHSTFLTAIFAIIKSKEFILVAVAVTIILVLGTDAWNHIKELIW